MDEVIRVLSKSNLNNIGRGEANESDKRQILNALRDNPEHFAFETVMDSLQPSDREGFNHALFNIEREIADIFSRYGQYGSLSCGPTLDDYTAIVRRVRALDQQTNEKSAYALFVRYILMPVVNLPTAADISPLDQATGEKTFAGMCLNLAVKLLLDRLSHVNGYWRSQEMELQCEEDPNLRKYQYRDCRLMDIIRTT